MLQNFYQRKECDMFDKRTFLTLHQARRHGGGAFRRCAPPPNDCLCLPKRKLWPSRDDCAPKKLSFSGLLECKSRPKTPKLAFTALEFVSKNCFFVIFEEFHWISIKFWDEDLSFFFFFLVFTSEFVKNRRNFETTTRICGNFGTKTFFLCLVFTFFVWSILE